MKLPVNCFKTITDYAKQNWAGDLAPAKERTWSQWNGLDGYKNIVKEEFGNTTRFSWKEGTSTTDWTYWLAVAMYASTDDYKGYVPVFHGKFLNYAAMTKSSWNPRDNSLQIAMSPGGESGIYLDAILIDYINLDAYWIPNQGMLKLCKAQKGKNLSWFAVGGSKCINSSFFKYFEITMVPMERIAPQLQYAGLGTDLRQTLNHIYIDTDHASSDKVLFEATIQGTSSTNKMMWRNGVLATTSDSFQPDTNWALGSDTLGTYVAVNGDWIVTKVYDSTFLKKVRCTIKESK